MNQTKHVVLICKSNNAGSGGYAGLVPSLQQALEDAGFTARVFSDIDAFTREAEQCTADHSPRATVSAGGDGTLALVASRVPPQTPLLPVPLGTENLMARYIGHGRSIDVIVETIRQGKTARLDAGMANDQLFLIMCSCGFDAEVVRRLHQSRRGHIWKLSYLLPTLRSAAAYRFPKMRISGSESTAAVPEVPWAFLFNAPRYAMGLRISEDANPQDGEFDLVCLEKGSVLSTLSYMADVSRNKLSRRRDTHQCTGTQFEIAPTDPDQQIPYQVDGDFAGFLPLSITVLPERINMLLPPKVILDQQTKKAQLEHSIASPTIAVT